MSARRVGVMLLLAGSELLGLALGEWYTRLFAQAVPPLAQSSFNMAATHAVFLGYGALAGAVIFLWAMLAVFLSRFFKSSPKDEPTGASAH